MARRLPSDPPVIAGFSPVHVLGSGGFEHNEQMRVKYQRAPITTEWTVGVKANTGDGIRAGERVLCVRHRAGRGQHAADGVRWARVAWASPSCTAW